jgi:hypothetical protein
MPPRCLLGPPPRGRPVTSRRSWALASARSWAAVVRFRSRLPLTRWSAPVVPGEGRRRRRGANRCRRSSVAIRTPAAAWTSAWWWPFPIPLGRGGLSTRPRRGALPGSAHGHLERRQATWNTRFERRRKLPPIGSGPKKRCPQKRNDHAPASGPGRKPAPARMNPPLYPVGELPGGSARPHVEESGPAGPARMSRAGRKRLGEVSASAMSSTFGDVHPGLLPGGGRAPRGPGSRRCPRWAPVVQAWVTPGVEASVLLPPVGRHAESPSV